MREQRDALLSGMTTLGLGGRAARIVDVENERELADVFAELDGSDEPVMVLGGGSNVVVDDEGWPGTVVRPLLRGIEVRRDGSSVHLRVGAGEVWDDLVAHAVARGWAGLACLSGIPGWCGAAPLQNIGAYGHEVGQVLTAVRVFDRVKRSYVSFSRGDCGFGYRTSVFRNESRYVVSAVELELRQGDPEAVRYAELVRALGLKDGARAPAARVRETVLALRRGKGMVVDPADPESRSAGSFFVNPIVDDEGLRTIVACALDRGMVQQGSDVPRFEADPGRWKVPAAWLIERAGFVKGTAHGAVGISRKHALALVNRGGTTSELLALQDRICEAVHATFGVRLRREPILVRAPRLVAEAPRGSR